MTGMVRAVRLMLIVQLLEDRAYSVDELAERCEVSKRTIQNDLLDLQSDPLYLPLIYCVRKEWRLCRNKPAQVAHEPCA